MLIDYRYCSHKKEAEICYEDCDIKEVADKIIRKNINHIVITDRDKVLKGIVTSFVQSPPDYLEFLRPYADDMLFQLNTNEITTNILSITATIGKFSAGFLKNAFLIIIFYFFAQYNGATIMDFIKRVVQMSVDETTLLIKELSSVMSVVFYSIIVNAMLQGVLFGVAI